MLDITMKTWTITGIDFMPEFDVSVRATAAREIYNEIESNLLHGSIFDLTLGDIETRIIPVGVEKLSENGKDVQFFLFFDFLEYDHEEFWKNNNKWLKANGGQL